MLRSVRVFPDLGLASITQHQTGPYRAWTLARALDQDRSGKVSQTALAALGREMKVNRRTWYVWIKQARALGLLIDDKSGKVVFLLSLEKTAKILHVHFIHSSVEMPARKLTGKGWRAFVFASIHNGKPTSRQTLKKMTGIAPRTQARYDAVAKTRRKKNIYVTNRPAADLPGAIDYGREATNFIVYDTKSKLSKLAHRRPDSRHPYGHPVKIRSKWEINKRLCSANSGNHPLFSDGQRANNLNVIFHNTRKEAEKAARVNGRFNLRLDSFYRSKQTAKANFYSLA
jgi:hypothetical protein